VGGAAYIRQPNPPSRDQTTPSAAVNANHWTTLPRRLAGVVGSIRSPRAAAREFAPHPRSRAG
jgi:hypothetical protein